MERENLAKMDPSLARNAQENESIGKEEIKEIDWEAQLSEVKQSFFCYLSSRIDSTKVTVREFSFKLILGLFLSGLMYGTLFMAICFIMYGMALGLNSLIGKSPSLGYLGTGSFFILLAIFSIKITLHKTRKNSLEQKVREYAGKC